MEVIALSEIAQNRVIYALGFVAILVFSYLVSKALS